MPSVIKGIIAGFVATVALSALMMMKSAMGVMPELNPIAMLTNMAGAQSMAMGWVAHFAIGSIAWGGLYALLYDKIPGGAAIAKAVVLAIAAWLVMMIAVMPMAGAGLFGMAIGPMAPVMTFVLHVVFGAVMGWVYRAQAPAQASS